MWLNILLIAIICVMITDLSGVVDYIKRHLYHYLTGNYNYPDTWDTPIIHLMSCSFCQTWWIGLLYLILIGGLSFGSIAYLLIISYLTTTFRDMIVFFKTVLDKAIDKLFKIIE